MQNDLTAEAPSGDPHAPQDVTIGQWDTTYEWRSILLLSLGFGLVGYDRYLIFPMFPSMMVSLHLGYTDLGKITGVLALTYGLAAFVAGRLADRIGRKLTMVAAMVAFSFLVGLNGLAAGVGSLILIRGLMGLAEGAYGPPSLVATMEASRPGRQGRSMGFYQMATPLIGLAIAPILVTQLMHVISWRYIFFLAAPPGLIVAVLLWRTIREPAEPVAALKPQRADTGAFKDILKYRNIWLASVAMFGWLSAVIVLAAFLPSYFIRFMHLPTATMGFIMSALGFGAVIGSLCVPALSDRFGRKPCVIVPALGAICVLFLLSRTGPDAGLLFTLLMLASFCWSGLIGLVSGPVAVESVPIHLRATATGTVIAVGEILGSGVSPVAAGYLVHHFGISAIFYFAIGSICLGLAASFFLHESAPGKVRN